jgi:hypothetical protein
MARILSEVGLRGLDFNRFGGTQVPGARCLPGNASGIGRYTQTAAMRRPWMRVVDLMVTCAPQNETNVELRRSTRSPISDPRYPTPISVP